MNVASASVLGTTCATVVHSPTTPNADAAPRLDGDATHAPATGSAAAADSGSSDHAGGVADNDSQSPVSSDSS